MTLLARINRLFKADVHAVLDSIEEPNLLLQQSIREMESSLDQTNKLLAKQQQTAKQTIELLAKTKEAQAESQNEIELCLKNNNDDLAKDLLRKKITLSRHIDSLDDQLRETNQLIEQLHLKKEEQSNVLDELKTQADIYASSPSKRKRPDQTDLSITEAEIEIALLKEKQRFAQSQSTNQ